MNKYLWSSVLVVWGTAIMLINLVNILILVTPIIRSDLVGTDLKQTMFLKAILPTIGICVGLIIVVKGYLKSNESTETK